MSVYSSDTVTLTYASTSQAFTALFADDESYEIVSLPKKRLDWTLLENIVGYRNIYTVRVQQITAAQRNFLYNFIQSADQNVTINGSAHSVFLRDEQLMLDLLDNYIGNVVLTMEFEDKTLTVPSTPSRSQGITTYSVGFPFGIGTTNKTGTFLKLSYNYGSGDTTRWFCVNLINCYKADILDKRWEYVDKNRGIKRLGYRLNYFVDFGGFGLGQTQAQLQDDRDWLKEFVLAPSKYVSGTGLYINEVINDFDEVRYSYLGNNIYNKTIQLSFKAKSLATNIPTVMLDKDNPDASSPTQFILDDVDFGTLDHNVLG